jgi:uncharacterized protein
MRQAQGLTMNPGTQVMDSTPQPRLILMLKYPRAGAVKTRLAPAMGEERACELYRALVRHTLNAVERLRFDEHVFMEVRIAGAPSDAAVREWLGEELHFIPQGDGELGERMDRAVHNAFAEGAPSVIVIGADCPELTAEHLRDGLRALESHDVVLGPAADGGYYLIGMRRFLPELFRGIQWGGEQVFEQTLAAGRELGVAFQVLDTLDDVDRPEDLPLWARTATAQAGGKGRVSVIIPAFNEAEHLGANPRSGDGR